MDDRRKKLEAFVKQFQSGDPLSEEFLPELPDDLTKRYPNRIAEMRALNARDLTESALANQVLKNTGVPIPSDFYGSKAEDFFNRIIKEQYPELEPNVRLRDNKGAMQQMLGYFQPGGNGIKQNIAINRNILNEKFPERAVATVLHEAGHQYDDNILGYKDIPDNDLSPKNLFDPKKPSRLVTDIDPTEAYERMAKGHHARIPDLRDADSFGLGALKSYLKSGKFKQIAGAVPYVGTAIAGAAALTSPDASAAVGDALVPGGLESLGPSEDDAIIENPQASPELRKAALERLKHGR